MKVEIDKGNESINAELVFRKKVTKFSNVAHLILPVDLIDKEVIIVVPKIATKKARK